MQRLVGASVERSAALRVLVVDWVAPEPDRDSGSVRAQYVLQILLAMRCAVTFVPVDWQRPVSYRHRLRASKCVRE